MFNTDIILQLQQFDYPIIHWFMVLISALGTSAVVLPFIMIITFGVDFRKGLILLNVVAWTTILTFILKDQINFPRPVDVDSRVNTVYFEKTNQDLSEVQPIDFLESFSSEVLDKTRNDEWVRHVFPSGHASVQVALWLSLYFLFRRRKVLYAGIFMVVSTFISRLYLAHHFLGDVIGGVLLGAIVASLLLLLVQKSGYLTAISHQFKSLSILWIPIFLVPFVFYTPIWVLGGLIGLNSSAALIILQRNFPVFHVITWKRISTALVTLLLVLGAYFLTDLIDQINRAGIELIVIILLNFFVVWGSIQICNRLNLIRFRF
ncbi:MAG: phosphatase PAP2 family protein [Vicingaceae bacterium]